MARDEDSLRGPASDLDLAGEKRCAPAPRRRTVLPEWLIVAAIAAGVLFALAAFGLLTLTSEARAAPVFRGADAGGRPVSLRLEEVPCSDARVLTHLLRGGISPELLAQLKSAVLEWGGRSWASCWVELEGRVYSFDEEGEPLNPPHGLPRARFIDDGI